MAYSILLRPAAIRDLKSLPSDVRSRVEKAIARLVDDPRTSGTRRLAGFDDEWRLRVGDCRVLYIINDPESASRDCSCRPPPRGLSVSGPISPAAAIARGLSVFRL